MQKLYVLFLLTPLLTGCVSPTVETLTEDGYEEIREGDYDSAIDSFNKALIQAPEFTNAYIGRGIAHLKVGDYEGAIRDFTEALKREPSSAEALAGRAYARAKGREDFRSAYADAKRAVELNPSSGLFRSRFGYILAGIGLFRDAERECMEAVRLDGKDGEIYYNYAAVLALKKDREGMLSELKKAFQISPSLKRRARKDRSFQFYWRDSYFITLTSE